MRESERGSVLLRILIVILSVAVILSVLIPQFKEKKEKEELALSRMRMSLLAEAQGAHLEAKGVYASNLDSLRAFLPEGEDFVSPTSGLSFQVSAVDSISYIIQSPDGQGLIRTGRKSWEEK